MESLGDIFKEVWPILVLVGNYFQNRAVVKKIPVQLSDEDLEDKMRGMFSKMAGAGDRIAKKIAKNPLAKAKKSDGGV